MARLRDAELVTMHQEGNNHYYLFNHAIFPRINQELRDAILRWLVERFETGRRYPEREVNELIQRHHPDFATLRRELIMARLMAREEGVYWRLA